MVVFQTISWHITNTVRYNYDSPESENEIELNIYMYGRTKDDNKSIIVNVKDFMPFFYILLPDNFKENSRLFDYITNKLKWSAKGRKIGLEKFQIIKRKKLYPYTAGMDFKFMKLFFSNMEDFKNASYMFKNPIKLNAKQYSFSVYESKIDPIVKFCHSRGIQTAGFVEIKDTEYESQLEVSSSSIEFYDLDAHTNLVILSYDIETQSSDHSSFPNPVNPGDFIGTIGVVSWVYGTDIKEKYVITKGPCSPIEGVEIITTDSEKKLLLEYCKLVKKINPDIVTGYNIWGFDDYYLATRFKLHGISLDKLSRNGENETKLISKVLKSSAYGDNEFKILQYVGRDTMDTMIMIKKDKSIISDYGLTKFSLDNVSKLILKSQKDEMNISDLFEYLDSNDPDKMAIVAKYCVQDTNLVIDLMKNLNFISNSIEMAKATYVPNNWLTFRGQQCKVMSLISKYCKRQGYTIPDNIPYDSSPFEGATVLEPMRGAYFTPVGGLDFASLYPSIMIAHNMCYSTLVVDPVESENVAYDTVNINDNLSISFVQNPDNAWRTEGTFKRVEKLENLDRTKCYQGILPMILSELMIARKKTKGLMEEHVKGSLMYNILNGKQSAQKITMNSVYGFTGTGNKGMLPCKEIAMSVTSRGRQMIAHTKKMAEMLYPCTALYGDSLPGSEYFYIHYKNNKNYVKIKFEDTHIHTGQKWIKDGDKEYIIPKRQYTTLSASGPTDIIKFIRHKTKKKLYRVNVIDKDGKNRSVIVTEDHSLIAEDGRLITPKDIKKGCRLFNL